MYYKLCSLIPIAVILSSFRGHRLEERLTEKDALLTTERRESEATQKLLDEAQGKNEELLMKIEDAERNIVHYQDTNQRSVARCLLRLISILEGSSFLIYFLVIQILSTNFILSS